MLLVLNQASRTSMEAGVHYARKRGIPKSNIIAIRTTTGDDISREDYERQIAAPIAAWLQRNSAQDRILYIVLTKGIPLHIKGSDGPTGTAAAVESELALLYRKLTGEPYAIEGPLPNPYFLGEASIDQAKQFRHAEQDIYLVCRLDGYSLEDIRAMIDRGATPSREGKILLDMKQGSDPQRDSRSQAVAGRLENMGFADRVAVADSTEAPTGGQEVLGYYSPELTDSALRPARQGIRFGPGALTALTAGADSRTLSKPDSPGEEWSLADAGTAPSGSLAGDFIHDGITGIAAQTSSVTADAAIRPDIVFPAYLSGFNLIESFYLALPYLSWKTVVVGDPLASPFRTRSLSREEIDRGLDPQTELPADFGARRLKNVSASAYKSSGIHPETTRLILLADARLARQDRPGAIQALEQAVERDNRLTSPQVLLASLYEAAGEHDKAIARYRSLLEIAPDNALILNNLAFVLAVNKSNLDEALPLAERAYALAPQNPIVAGTLGWIYHLAGRNSEAVKLLEAAVRGQNRNPEMHLHFAIVSAETGNPLAAEIALERALEINPKLEEREDVRRLRSLLKAPGGKADQIGR